MSTWRVESRKMKLLGRLHYTEYAIDCDETKLSSGPFVSYSDALREAAVRNDHGQPHSARDRNKSI